MVRQFGRYKIIRQIGKGAMGIVYKAHDPVIDRTLAIKTLRMELLEGSGEKDEFIKRFFREAQTAGKLSHPSLVTIFDMGHDKKTDTLFIAMEFIEGKTLKDILQEKGALTIEQALPMLAQIASGLDFAHKHSIIHRDIKPANIIITPSGQVKITDFGVAKISGTHLTQTGRTLGTPSYMSPEQILGKTITAKSDIFSLGVLAFEMLFGEKPFKGDNITTIVYKILNEPPRVVDESVVQANPELFKVVMTCMDKHPEQRFDTAMAFVAELRRVAPVADEDMEDVTQLVEEATVIADDTSKTLLAAVSADKPSPPASRYLLIGAIILVGLLALTAIGLYVHKEISAKPGEVKDRVFAQDESTADAGQGEDISIVKKDSETVDTGDITDKLDLEPPVDAADSGQADQEQAGDPADLEQPEEPPVEQDVITTIEEDLKKDSSVTDRRPDKEPRRPAATNSSRLNAWANDLRSRISFHRVIRKDGKDFRGPKGFTWFKQGLLVCDDPLGSDFISYIGPGRGRRRIGEGLDTPHDVKLAKRGELNVLIVTDTNNHSIKIFNELGHHLSTISDDLEEPCFISARPGEDSFYVTDMDSGYVFHFDTSGRLLAKSGHKLSKPMGIQHHNGSVYVLDSSKRTMNRFDLGLRFQDSFPLDDALCDEPVSFIIVENHFVITDVDKGHLLVAPLTGGALAKLTLPKLKEPFYIAARGMTVVISDKDDEHLKVFRMRK